MLTRRFILILGLLTGIVGVSLVPLALQGPAQAPQPGPLGDGAILLPNGWRIAPAGTHRQIGDLPLAMVASPDGRFLVVTNNGWSKPTLTVFDTRHRYVVGRVPVDTGWLGLAWHPDGTRLYSSGAEQNSVREFTWAAGKLTPVDPIVLGPPQRKPAWQGLENAGFVGGLAVTPDGKRLFATQVFGEKLSVVDLEERRLERDVPLPAEPYTCLLSPDGRTLFVSIWGGARVLVFDAVTLEQTADIPVGEHPSAMVLSRDGRRLFVACANTNAVWVIDLASRAAREQISVALYPEAPVGTTPNGLGLSPNGETLLVANADNNTVAIVDVAEEGRSEVEGFIPAGWYPTAAMFSQDGRRIYVLNGKGLASGPNPRGPNSEGRGADGQYTASMLPGALSIVDTPDRGTLQTMTKRVYELTRYTDARRLAPPEALKDSPVPQRVGDASPIKYVFYIIRENRTYDQVLGDIPKGNGDPTLTIFGEEVTPNAHALVNAFVLFDNFYVDAEVSADGHAYSTGAYATDVVEKTWPTDYGRSGAPYLSEGGGKQRNPYGNVAAPPRGYLWDFAKRAGVSVRSYGEFANMDDDGRVSASVPGLKGLVHPTYPPYDLEIPDARRADIWLAEFREFEANGNLPRLSILHLPNDHTSGTRPGAPTPRAMVAENDVALGRIVEAITKSRYWKESAIFVVEDDAQNGPDHVDAHRSVALVMSPFAKRGAVDSTLYSTAAMLRTIELILGLEPMSQYDAAATPMYSAFQPTPVLTPHAALAARVPLDEKNDWTSPGAEASLRMNLEQVDRAPEQELNEILWKAARGKDAQMPPPRRTAFVRPIADDDEH